MPLDPLRGILQHDFPRLQFVPDPVRLGPILVLARRGTGRDQSLDFGVEFLLLAILKEPQHPAQLAEQGSCSPAGAFGGPAGGNEDVDVLGQLEQGGDGVGGVQVVIHGADELLPALLQPLGEGGIRLRLRSVLQSELQPVPAVIQPVQRRQNHQCAAPL